VNIRTELCNGCGGRIPSFLDLCSRLHGPAILRQEPSLTIKQDPKLNVCGGEEKIPAPKPKSNLLTVPVLTDMMVAC
jgi:hypothetical protein